MILDQIKNSAENLKDSAQKLGSQVQHTAQDMEKKQNKTCKMHNQQHII